MIRRVLAGAVVATAVIVMSAAAAYGHMGIATTGPAAPDGLVPVTLTVPNERSDSGTVKIELYFPATPRIAAAQPAPVAGWTPVVDQAGGAVNRITWTGGPVTGESSITLPVTLGPIPTGTQQIDFKALQTYQDGQVVRWIEPTPPGGEEPERPAPVLTVSADATTDVPPPQSSTTSTTEARVIPDQSPAAGTSDDASNSTGVIIGVVVAALVVGAAVGYFVVRRRRRAHGVEGRGK